MANLSLLFFIASLYRQYQSSLTYHPMSDMKANTAVNSAIFGRLRFIVHYKREADIDLSFTLIV